MKSLKLPELLKKRETPLAIEGTYQYDELPSREGVRSALTVYLCDVSGFRLKGTIQAELDLECDSCLGKFQKKIAIELDEQYVFQDKSQREYRRNGGQEIQLNDFYEEIDAEGELDLKDLVRQMLLLETSAKQVCGMEKCEAAPYEYWVEPKK